MRIAITTLLAFTLASCSGSSGIGTQGPGFTDNPNPLVCSAQNSKQWVLENMQDSYLFSDQLPTVQASNFDGPEDYIRALRVAPYDRFSYVSDAETSDAFFEEGESFGFGMRLEWSKDQNLYFTLVEPLSPLGLAGVDRGDEILAINNVPPQEFTREFFEQALGTGDEEVTATFEIGEQSGGSRTVEVKKSLYSVQTVLDAKVLTQGNSRIGYLNFLTFIEPSEAELNSAFNQFRAENIDELVLDLRHNLGGRISIAEQLASQIAGNAVEGGAFTRLNFNRKYSEKNVSFPFEVRQNAVNLPRVFVLTSPNTCSASEMVINNLRPFIDVITIGDTTCGKPYGSSSRRQCGKAINALEVEFVNR